MSRSCHRATFSTAVVALPRSTRARPVMRSVAIGLRLWGIALEPFCARAEGLGRLQDLRALQVADLGGQALEPRAGQRDRLEHLGVAVARDDLRRDVLGLQPQPRQHARLEVRARRRVRPDRAADRPGRGLREGALEPLEVAVRLEGEAGELDAERRRLGVDAVRAPDADRVDVRAACAASAADQLARALDDDLAGGAQLQGQRGVEHVGRGQAEVDPAPGRAGASRPARRRRRRRRGRSPARARRPPRR